MDAPLVLRIAEPSVAAGNVALRDALAKWQQENFIDQWSPGEFTHEQVSQQIDRHEWRVGPGGPVVQFAYRLADSDEFIWPDAHPEAMYIHGLMIHRP